MSVLIKGMEMPESCTSCVLCDDEFFGYYKCMYSNGYRDEEDRAPDCPLIEVPAPHGDLIDRDELYENRYFCWGDGETDLESGVVQDIISNAPTVIEAEK